MSSQPVQSYLMVAAAIVIAGVFWVIGRAEHGLASPLALREKNETLTIDTVRTDVMEDDGMVNEPDLVQHPELPPYLVRVDAFEPADLPESEPCGVLVLQEPGHRFIHASSRLRTEAAIAPPERVCYLGFPGQRSSGRPVERVQELILVLEVHDLPGTGFFQAPFKPLLGGIVQHEVDLARHLLLREPFSQGLLHELNQLPHRLAVCDDLLSPYHCTIEDEDRYKTLHSRRQRVYELVRMFGRTTLARVRNTAPTDLQLADALDSQRQGRRG